MYLLRAVIKTVLFNKEDKMSQTPRPPIINPTDYPVGTRLEVTCSIEDIPPGIQTTRNAFWFEIMEWGTHISIDHPNNRVKVSYDNNKDGIWVHPSKYVPISVIPVKENGGRMVSVPPCILNPTYHPKGTRVKGDYQSHSTKLDFTIIEWKWNSRWSDVIVKLTGEVETMILDSDDIMVTDVFIQETKATDEQVNEVLQSESSLNDEFMRAYFELKRLSGLLEINVTMTLL